MSDRIWTVYLSGEIHTNWREELIAKTSDLQLPIQFTSPQTDHETSDDCGVKAFGDEEKSFWKDYKGAKLNSISNRRLIEEADLVVIRFGEKYRQWNAAFDAGLASALGLSYITQHDESLDHALKEVDAQSSGTARSIDDLVKALKYISTGSL